MFTATEIDTKDLFSEFAEFETEVDKMSVSMDEGSASEEQVDDYKKRMQKYIDNLSIYAAKRLSLPAEAQVVLKPVYLHGTKIHSLIYNVCINGRRYSARLKRRVSLGLRDRESDRWFKMITRAHEIAVEEEPPVGLDPRLEELDIWVGSSSNHAKMTFELNGSRVVVNAVKVREASGKREDLIEILKILKLRGL